MIRKWSFLKNIKSFPEKLKQATRIRCLTPDEHILSFSQTIGTPDFSTAPFRKGLPQRGYQSIKNKNHPCAIWARESLEHYMWLCMFGAYLCQEYQHRFGEKKEHSCQEHIYWLTVHPPSSLKSSGWRQPPQAMPPEFQRSDSIAAYRAYYIGGKAKLLQYSKRSSPHWLRQGLRE